MGGSEPEITTLHSSFVNAVTQVFAEHPIAGGAYVVELLEAEKVLRLRAVKEGRPAIVAGTVNEPEKHAELRTYEHAFLVHQVRFGTAFGVSKGEWEQLLKRLEGLLESADIASVRVGPSPEVLRDSRQANAKGRISPRAIALFVVVTLLALFVMYRVVVRLGHP